MLLICAGTCFTIDSVTHYSVELLTLIIVVAVAVVVAFVFVVVAVVVVVVVVVVFVEEREVGIWYVYACVDAGDFVL